MWILCGVLYLGLAGFQLLARYQPSNRLSIQTTQVLGVPFLVLSFDALTARHVTSSNLAFLVAFLLAALWIADAVILWSQKPDARAHHAVILPQFRHASTSLNLDPSIWETLPIPDSHSPDAAVAAAFFSTQQAAFRLHNLNQEEQMRVDAGQQFLLLGLGAILFAILAVLLASPGA